MQSDFQNKIRPLKHPTTVVLCRESKHLFLLIFLFLDPKYQYCECMCTCERALVIYYYYVTMQHPQTDDYILFRTVTD